MDKRIAFDPIYDPCATNRLSHDLRTINKPRVRCELRGPGHCCVRVVNNQYLRPICKLRWKQLGQRERYI